MIHSKAVLPLKEGKKFPWDRPDTFWFNFTYAVQKKVNKYIKKPWHFLKKCTQYCRLLWNDYDWDGHYLYPIMELKLKRMLKSLKHGHLEQDPRHLKALEIAIAACQRLHKDDYWSPHDRHDKKWGKTKTWFTKSKRDPKCSEWHSSRPKAKTKKQIEQERKEFLHACKMEEMLKTRDRKVLFGIIAKYIPFWWD